MGPAASGWSCPSPPKTPAPQLPYKSSCPRTMPPATAPPMGKLSGGKRYFFSPWRREIVLVSLWMSEGPCRKVSVAWREEREYLLGEILRSNALEISHDSDREKI